MNISQPERSAGRHEDPADVVTAYKAELDAARKNLCAERSDLEHLLLYIHDKQVPRRQVPDLLSQAYSRLTSLRGSRPEDSGLATEEPRIAALIERVHNALQTGEAFSLEDAHQALEDACRTCLDLLSDEPLIVALMRAGQARIAALKQDYRYAAEMYAQAAATPGLDAPSQWRYQTEGASVLEDLGREFGDNPALEQAIDLYENTIRALAPRIERPDEWATTQNNLGNALGVLGQRQRGTWMLERSITAFENALSERSRDRVPLDWAATLNNLGTALRLLGEHRKGPRTLEQAVAAYRSALAERTRERVPQDWAMTQNNLGAALQKLGERQDDPRILDEAVAAYENALREWTRERMPVAWAMTTANLGVARRTLAERAQDVAISRMAEADLEAAAEVFHDASHAQYYELAEEQLAKARKLTAGLGG